MRRLAEAIILGSLEIKPEGGKYFNDDQTMGCAIGMAATASLKKGTYDLEDPMKELGKLFPILDKWLLVPCECFESGWSTNQYEEVADIIYHLFDVHVMGEQSAEFPWAIRWTLDQLVDWLEIEERQVEEFDEQKKVSRDVCHQFSGHDGSEQDRIVGRDEEVGVES